MRRRRVRAVKRAVPSVRRAAAPPASPATFSLSMLTIGCRQRMRVRHSCAPHALLALAAALSLAMICALTVTRAYYAAGAATATIVAGVNASLAIPSPRRARPHSSRMRAQRSLHRSSSSLRYYSLSTCRRPRQSFDASRAVGKGLQRSARARSGSGARQSSSQSSPASQRSPYRTLNASVPSAASRVSNGQMSSSTLWKLSISSTSRSSRSCPPSASSTTALDSTLSSS